MVFDCSFVNKMLPPTARPLRKILKCDIITVHGQAILNKILRGYFLSRIPCNESDVTIYLKCYISTTQIKIPQCRSAAPKHEVKFKSKRAAEDLAWSSPNSCVRPKKTRSRRPAQSSGKINKLATHQYWSEGTYFSCWIACM